LWLSVIEEGEKSFSVITVCSNRGRETSHCCDYLL
jgi:hypothetical protein